MLLRTVPALFLIGLLFLAPSPSGWAQESETGSESSDSGERANTYPARRTLECEGWTLHVSEALFQKDSDDLKKALDLLEQQLQEIIRVVPGDAVIELKKVPLWISDEYPKTPPRAEYHPDAGWLESNGRDPAMVRGVEFTNVRVFEAETKRMPNFVLHELAHAFHHRVLEDGFGNAAIREAYENAKSSGRYDAVEQRFGDGRSTTTKSYAMTTPQEYFAESTEAFFSTNDFFPFTLEQLRQHDPEMTELVARLWGIQFTTQPTVEEDLSNWKYSGSIWINTTPQGADLPEGSEILDFPLCVRLYSDSFDFSECQKNGGDLRWSLADTNVLLSHEIDSWDPENGTATIWVRVPKISGNTRQEIKLHWGNPEAKPLSRERRVFDASNGYTTVWHLGETPIDSVGSLEAKDTGTLPVAGMIGQARRFSDGRGLSLGTSIESLPTGSEPHTTEAWVWIDRPNTTLVAWGNEKAQGKVVMQYRSPSRINMDCYFSGGNIGTDRDVPLGEWQHVVYTYSPEATRIYVNGQLAGETKEARPVLAIESPARFYVGGWYDRYDFEGILDELRVSSTVRDSLWIRLQYENQKPHSTLCGTIVKSGSESPEGKPSVSPDRVKVVEGETAAVTAVADGAQKLYWMLERNGKEEVILTDRLTCSIAAGRVLEDETAKLRLRAVYADGVRELLVPIEIADRIAEPEISGIQILGNQASGAWDGRVELALQAEIANRDALKNSNADELTFSWRTSQVAVGSRVEGERLILSRALGDGDLEIEVSVSNGGPAVTASTLLRIQQPPRAEEAWIERPAAGDERPRDGQFIAREGWGDSSSRMGALVYRGNLKAERAEGPNPERVILRAFDEEELVAEKVAVPSNEGDYEVKVELPAALQRYRCELVAERDGKEQILHQASDLLCGDVYLIIGQSNAVATDFGDIDEPTSSPWVRTFGATDTGEAGARKEQWGDARARAPGGELEIGYWGLELGKALVEQEKLPICIINGAVGGTRIDQHQRNPLDPTDVKTIYGRLLWRVQQAGLTHGVRGVFWHQGENDQGADGPTNRFGYETYESFFISLAASWKEDFPNIEHLFVFQIWPRACAMGFEGSDNRLREVQRSLNRPFSHLSVMSTLGIRPPGGCHYPAEGYGQFSKLMLPLVRQKIYGRDPSGVFTPPNLKRARWQGTNRDEIELEFDSEIVWNEQSVDQFFLGRQRLSVASGAVEGNKLILRLTAPIESTDSSIPGITYVDGDSWSQERLLMGANGIAILTFCDVPLLEGDSSVPSEDRKP